MHRRAVLGALAGALFPAAFSSAEIIDLGAGWEAEIPDGVPITIDAIFASEALQISVFTEFANFGSLDALPVTFRQTAETPGTATMLVLAVADIINNSGQSWVGFRYILEGGSVEFDADESSGFAAEPFGDAFFDPGGQLAEFTGGVLGVGETWSPGSGPGGLVMNVDISGGPLVSFTLLQAPIPTPGSLALLAIGGLILIPRRMRP